MAMTIIAGNGWVGVANIGCLNGAIFYMWCLV